MIHLPSLRWVVVFLIVIAMRYVPAESALAAEPYAYKVSHAYRHNSKMRFYSSASTYAHSSSKKYRPRRMRTMASAFWREDAYMATGKERIEIDLGSQVARFYRGGELIGQSPVSTGRRGYETRTGSYRILNKDKDHYSNLYGEFVNSSGRVVGYGDAGDTPPRGTRYRPSPMPYFLRLTHTGLGMHAGYLPGYPASHGCIRMPRKMARLFYKNISVGGQVDIVH